MKRGTEDVVARICTTCWSYAPLHEKFEHKPECTIFGMEIKMPETEKVYPDERPNRKNVIRDMMTAARSLRESMEGDATTEEVIVDADELLTAVEAFLGGDQ